MQDAEILARINSHSHWYHQIEIKPGIVTPGINDSAGALKLLNAPLDCTGLRVLDIGTRDGFFAFEFERRGAEVVAIDYVASDKTGFAIASELLGSKVTFHQDNIYNVSREKYGEFDIVLFLGLIYHLRDPMRAIEIVHEVCLDQLYLETQIIDDAFLLPSGELVPLKTIAPELVNIPIMQFYPAKSLNNDYTNYWAPNFKCMEDMLVETDFEVLEKTLNGQRAIFKCRILNDSLINYHNSIAKGLVS